VQARELFRAYEMKAQGKKIYGVSEITREIKVLLEGRFPGVWVEGEVSNVRRPSSGHVYFTLKDEKSQLQAVIYRSQASRIVFGLEDGLHVIAFGDVSVYAKGGRYQLTVMEVEPRGRGALQLAFEQLKARLAKEGLFGDSRKKAIPLLPERIGVVTSPTGAAIRDILNVIQRRFANVRLLVSPVSVQGDAAPAEIVEALDGFNSRNDADVIIITRGGGSMEDLRAFNEEIVARAIARSRIPVISAVGHEIDFTISDFVADLRVPTPSSAAELVIGKKSELQDKVKGLVSRLSYSIRDRVGGLRRRLLVCEQNYILQAPESMVRQHQQHLDELEGGLLRSFKHKLEVIRAHLKLAAGKLESLSPLAILARGYSVIFREKDGVVVCSSAQLKAGERIKARLYRGGLIATVTKKMAEN
jgi:exodeoxyribonuclease VII large subunit